MPSVGDLSAFISVNGIKLKEYTAKASRGSKVGADGCPQRTVFIVAETAKQFSICVEAKNATEADRIQALVLIDGRQICAKILKRSGEREITGYRTRDGCHRRAFFFSNIQLVSDLGITQTASIDTSSKEKFIKGSEAGEIVIEFWRFVPTEECKTLPVEDVGEVKVHETDKSGVYRSHTTSFGAPQPVVNNRPWLKGTHPDPAPLHRIIFSYRSQALLEAEGLIKVPKPPVIVTPPIELQSSSPTVAESRPKPAPEKDSAPIKLKRAKPEPMEFEEIKALIKPSIKPEADSGKPSPKPQKTKQVVDLTGDD